VPANFLSDHLFQYYKYLHNISCQETHLVMVDCHYSTVKIAVISMYHSCESRKQGLDTEDQALQLSTELRDVQNIKAPQVGKYLVTRTSSCLSLLADLAATG
jgi:hypothetical protein